MLFRQALLKLLECQLFFPPGFYLPSWTSGKGLRWRWVLMSCPFQNHPPDTAPSSCLFSGHSSVCKSSGRGLGRGSPYFPLWIHLESKGLGVEGCKRAFWAGFPFTEGQKCAFKVISKWDYIEDRLTGLADIDIHLGVLGLYTIPELQWPNYTKQFMYCVITLWRARFYCLYFFVCCKALICYM